ncbi:MAG: hypothetical protein WCG31_11620 [Deltaproteobacteria bacterium]
MKFITRFSLNSRIRLAAFAAALLCALPLPPSGYAAPAELTYEKPQLLKASYLLPPNIVAGDLFRVGDQVSTEMYMGHFTLYSDVGTFEVSGENLLKIRIAELPAIRQLDSMSKSKEFLAAAGNAAVKPVKSAVNMVENPVETVKGIPSGLSRFFDRVGSGIKSIANSATDSDSTGGEKGANTAGRVGDFTITALGFEDSRRQLAQDLAVDPYTTNPILADKLTNMAWVTFSGKLGVNTLVSVFVPVSIAISGTAFTNDLVYNTTKSDLIIKNREMMLDIGGSETLADTLLGNRWYSLTVLTSLLTGLESLSKVEGRSQLLELATKAASEEEARFVAATVQMLARMNGTKVSLAKVSARGTVVGIARNGAIVVPAPVDYLSWTKQIALLAQRQDLRAPHRSIWLTGKISTRAREGFEALGWTINRAAPL